MTANAPYLWKTVNELPIYRALGFSTGFDGLIQGFKLSADAEWLTSILADGFFLDFFHVQNDHLFLRRIESEQDWPVTRMLDIDLKMKHSSVLFESNSSFIRWSVESDNQTQFSVVTSSSRRTGERSGFLVTLKDKVSAEYRNLSY